MNLSGWVAIGLAGIGVAILVREVSRLELDDEDRVDVWSFRAKERLKVHEARTAADLKSSGRQPLHLPNCEWWARWAKQRRTVA